MAEPGLLERGRRRIQVAIFDVGVQKHVTRRSVNIESSRLKPDSSYSPILPDISVQTFPLSHGANDHGPYESSAYFVRHDLSGTEFLFFGDVEPDSLAAKPQSINVWRAAAPKIPDTLRTVFIECSYPSGRPDNQLFGHLTPEHLLDELVALATEVRKSRPLSHASDAPTRHTRKRQRRLPGPTDIRGALSGLTVYITHCKDAPTQDGRPTREVILEQVRSLVEAKELGCEVLAVQQGMYIRKCQVDSFKQAWANHGV